MQGHGRPPGEMPRQRRDDVLGEQHAAAVHPEGAFDAARVELWEAPWQLVERHPFIDLPMPANTAAERSAQVSPLPVSASVPVAA